MFSGVRLRLTAIYLLAAFVLVVLVGGSAYALLGYYFQSSTDLALQHRLANEFRQLRAPLPDELEDADAAWYAGRDSLLPGLRISEGKRRDRDDDHEDDDDHDRSIDAELAAIFVMPVDRNGSLLTQGPARYPMPPDQAAIQSAEHNGHDWRTVNVDGTPVRLLTYQLPGVEPAIFLQAGRPLDDHSRLLAQFLFGLLVVGGSSVVLLGFGSWWLAGRSLAPAQQAWERQQTFIAGAGHELRAPLTLLRASAEVALRHVPESDAEQRSLIGDVLAEADHMSRLVDDLLLLSRLDTGRLQIEPVALDVAPLLADVERQVGRLAAEREIEIAVDGQGTVVADPTRLRQMLLILLDNALRYTPAGGRVDIVVRPHGKLVRFTVSDNGPGVTPDHLPHLFDRFYQADAARSRDTGGSGLGLAIAKALAEAQHGHIGIDSRPGGGTRVWFDLPVAK